MAWQIGSFEPPSNPRFELNWPERELVHFNFALANGRKFTQLHLLPTLGRQKDSKPLVDVIYSGAPIVSDRFRDIIEHFEPGVHDFFPIELYDKKGNRYQENRYIFNVAQRFDCMIVQGAQISWGNLLRKDLDAYGMPYIERVMNPKRMSLQAIRGRHVWRRVWIGESLLTVSNDVHAALNKGKIRRLDLKFGNGKPYEELDVPWSYEEQAPEILKWHREHQSKYVLENYPDWVREFCPQWLKQV